MPDKGVSTPAVLPARLTTEQTLGFQERLEDSVGLRSGHAKALAAFAAGVTAVRPGPFRLTDLIALGSDIVSSPVHDVRRALDRARWEEAALRRVLVAAAQDAEIDALAIEHVEVLEAGRPCDIVSLSAVTSLGPMSVGWQISAIPPTARGDEVIELSQAERLCVCSLLHDFAGDVAAISPATSTALPPVVATTPAFGENIELRDDLGSIASEYVLAVGGTYADHRLMGHPYEIQFTVMEDESAREKFAQPELEEVLVDPLGQPDLRPRRILRDGGDHRPEYAAAYQRGSEVAFAVCGPEVAAPPGVPRGHRLITRALGLIDVARQIESTDAAYRLRVAEFRHLNEVGWRRGALVMSALQGHLQGWFEVS